MADGNCEILQAEQPFSEQIFKRKLQSKIKVFSYSPTDVQLNCLKTILKFTLKLTLKQLQHVSMQSPSSGSALFELAKVTVVKIIN
jgi:hypothetical protein